MILKKAKPPTPSPKTSFFKEEKPRIFEKFRSAGFFNDQLLYLVLQSQQHRYESEIRLGARP